MTEEKKPEIEVVYLGPCALDGGKKGVLFIPRDQIEGHPERDFATLWRAASPFGLVRGLIVGAAYKSSGTIENNEVRTLGTKALRLSGRVNHPALVEFELRAEASAETDKLAALERKIKAQPRLMEEVEQLGRFLAKVPWSQKASARQAIIQAIDTAARGAS